MRMGPRNIYFVRQSGGVGPIKIGSSAHPSGRLKALQTWSPVQLELLAWANTHWNTEIALHRHFLADRSHGEWFSWSADLQRVIDCVAENGDVPDWIFVPKDNAEWCEWSKLFPNGKPPNSSALLFKMTAIEKERAQ